MKYSKLLLLSLSPGMQGLWLGVALSANRPRDALLLGRAGFHAPIEVVLDIKTNGPCQEFACALP